MYVPSPGDVVRITELLPIDPIPSHAVGTVLQVDTAIGIDDRGYVTPPGVEPTWVQIRAVGFEPGSGSWCRCELVSRWLSDEQLHVLDELAEADAVVSAPFRKELRELIATYRLHRGLVVAVQTGTFVPRA